MAFLAKAAADVHSNFNKTAIRNSIFKLFDVVTDVEPATLF